MVETACRYLVFVEADLKKGVKALRKKRVRKGFQILIYLNDRVTFDAGR